MRTMFILVYNNLTTDIIFKYCSMYSQLNIIYNTNSFTYRTAFCLSFRNKSSVPENLHFLILFYRI